MGKFIVLKCIEVKENGYDGYCVVMAWNNDPDFVLFFPISKDNAKMINYVVENKKYDMNTDILGVYHTMLNSWESSDKYLSGIMMDAIYAEEAKEKVFSIKIALSNNDGDIDSLIPVNFTHAIVLAVMTKTEIIISDALLDEMMPDDVKEEISKHKHMEEKKFPEDKKIIDIAKKIMSGKIKDN